MTGWQGVSTRVLLPMCGRGPCRLGGETGKKLSRSGTLQARPLDPKVCGVTPPMSRRANLLDNAPMKIFFHTLKTELAHHRTYATREEAKPDQFAFTEEYYNRRRLHSSQPPDSGLGRTESAASSVTRPRKPWWINPARRFYV